MIPEYAAFGLTEEEVRERKVSTERFFLEILVNKGVVIEAIKLSDNDYGEFLFVTLRRRYRGEVRRVTFWGLGYHERRARWIYQTWEFYQSMKQGEGAVRKQDAINQMKAREAEIRAEASMLQTRSQRAKLFEFLADLMDDDGAATFLEDYGKGGDEDGSLSL